MSSYLWSAWGGKGLLLRDASQLHEARQDFHKFSFSISPISFLFDYQPCHEMYCSGHFFLPIGSFDKFLFIYSFIYFLLISKCQRVSANLRSTARMTVAHEGNTRAEVIDVWFRSQGNSICASHTWCWSAWGGVGGAGCKESPEPRLIDAQINISEKEVN